MQNNQTKNKSSKKSTTNKKSTKPNIKKNTQQKNIERKKSTSTISKNSKQSKMMPIQQETQNKSLIKKEVIRKAKERKTVHNYNQQNLKNNFNKTQGQQDLKFTFNPEDFSEGFSQTEQSKKQTDLPLTKSPSKTSSLFSQIQSKKFLQNNNYENIGQFQKVESKIDFQGDLITQEMNKKPYLKDLQKIYQSEKQIFENSNENNKKFLQRRNLKGSNIQGKVYNQYSINNIQQHNSIRENDAICPVFSQQLSNTDCDLRQSLDSNQFLDSTDFGVPLQNQILIDFQSNYGNPNYIGLQQIRVFDKDQNEPEIGPENIKFFINNKFVQNELAKNLINQDILITNQERAFKAKINNSYEILDCSLKIELPQNFELSAILIWNYNLDSSIGVKECAIHYNTQLVFADIIQRATETEQNAKNYQLIPLQGWSLARRSTNQLLKKIFTQNRQNTPQQKYNAPHAFVDKSSNKKNMFQKEFVNSLTPKKLQKNINQQSPMRKSTLLKPIIKAEDLNTLYETKSNKSAKKLSKMKSKKSIHSRNKSREFENSIQKYLYAFQNSVYRTLEEVPTVQQLNFILVDNWGDQDYIGLNGFEFFDVQGKQIYLHSQQIKCFKQLQDKNANTTDVQNLISGVYPTRDSNQHWIYKKDKKHKEVDVQIEFGKPIKIAMIRIWNYNCSRIKAARGIKNIVILANNKFPIFIGKIRKSSGSLRKGGKNHECILFTKDTQFLRQMSVRDWLFKKQKDRDKSTNKIKETVSKNMIYRPPTIDKDNSQIINYGKFHKQQTDKYNVFKHVSEELYFSNNMDQQFDSNNETQHVKIQILETWQQSNIYEVYQIEFYEQDNKKIPQDEINITSSNKSNAFDLNECFRSKRAVKFYKNQNKENFIQYEFKQSYNIHQIKIHPSIHNNEPSLNNIKRIHIFLNDKKITKKLGYYINLGFSGKNMLSFQNIDIQQFQNPQINFNFKGNWVSCMNIKFHLKSTFGDPFYIGLNEIEIFDIQGKNVLQTKKFNIQGLPPGVIIDPEMITDQRIVSNLYNKSKTSQKYKDIWLTFLTKYPVKCLNYTQNIIAIQFEDPITISMINIWNYIKDPKRAVREVEIYADNKIIFSGYLYDPKINQLSTIIFSKFIQKDDSQQYQINPITNQESSLVQLTNETKTIISAPQERFEDFRPLTGQDKQLIINIKYSNLKFIQKMNKDETTDTYIHYNNELTLSQVLKSRRQSRLDSLCFSELARPHRLSFNLHENLLIGKGLVDQCCNLQDLQSVKEINSLFVSPKSQKQKLLDLCETTAQKKPKPNLKKNNKIKKQQKSKQKKIGCKCKQSNCLRLHCACFKTLGYCGPSCGCKNCLNKKQHEKTRKIVIEKTQIIHKNAFENHILFVEGQKINKFGCNCKTGCQKKYCDCKKFNAKCSPICRCEECKNEKVHIDKEQIQSIYKPHSRKKHKLIINYEEDSTRQKNCIVFKTYKKKSLQLN